MLKEILKQRGVPELKSREEMLDILQTEEYGFIPKKPDSVEFIIHENIEPLFCARKATLKKIEAVCKFGEKSFTFPFYFSYPNKEGKLPFFVNVNFRDNLPDLYLPIEEITDNGFAVLSFCHNDVTSDKDDFTSGLAGILYEGGKRNPTDAGKLAMWAWATHRIMDFAETCENLDLNRAAVCGHSRLGKTALLSAATDTRFKFAYSNDSGCSGAAITRGKQGETVDNICGSFSYWFCENYSKYKNNEAEMPFDQHYLIASIAPRFVIVGSAAKDTWADPDSEMLSCVVASKAYEDLGLKGFICEDRLPEIDDIFFEGNIGYHLRANDHYFSRLDWQRLMDFINIHS